MKRIIFLLGVLATLVFAATPVLAQTLYVHGGAGWPSSSAFNNAYKAGLNAGVGVGIPLTSKLEGVVRGSYDRFGNDISGIDSFSSFSATGNLKLNGPMTNNRVMPYALAGAGLFRLGVEDNYETDFGFQFGAGVGIKTTPKLNLMVEPNFVVVMNEGDNVQYFPVRLGFSYFL